MKMPWLVFIVPIVVLTAAREGFAQTSPWGTPSPPPSASPGGVTSGSNPPSSVAQRPPVANRWYGGQTLLVAGSSLAVGIVGATLMAEGNDTLGATTLTLASLGLMFGGPIVHWARGHGSRGAMALGLYWGTVVGAGAVGTLVACASTCGRSDFGFIYAALVGGGIGAGVGWLTALVVDVSMLTYEDVPVRRAASTSGGFTLVPNLSLGADRTTFGVTGTF